ncbi:nitrous oxide reductase accessory protein NosL [Desulfoferrobacter suflitae]|uniref:nitrous oxide reductase accessory protein NosL n=1 Tax=Desulfoferrobacter suflitae TaxID=2865782 RepID=UPI002164AF25|nr:nitrous oxide reductase accessory protein NosL [Desulfoferrobacter suflitae]MCK8600795.1 nitrous oxide reductase accessory protein NosL [Desulfoferrobacter suflitae]
MKAITSGWMKGCIFLMIFAFGVTGPVVFDAAKASAAQGQDISCRYCGMMKAKFGYSWMVIDYNDGTQSEVCSIHCAALDMALNTGKTPKAIAVGDYNTQEPIDAEKAYWVIGGNKPGVMTARAKWAFAGKEAADKFINEHGGELATFDDAVKASFEDMYQDTLMIRKKKAAMQKKMGS